MKQILKFKKEGLEGLHFFTENLNYPVVVASYNKWEKQQLTYLENEFGAKNFTTTSLCRWCVSHHVQYQFVYPINIRDIFENPFKYINFLILKRRLKELALL